jgi:2,3-bisphosphoglycerate-dependent phosphoglycerate mutase
MKTLVLLRHGQSQWNLENIFTGWVNVDLSEKGIEEAKKAGQILKKHNFEFDHLYTSVLLRANRTAELTLAEMGISPKETKDWRLNERHYGGLTGLNKKETAEKHGAEQVQIWRRSYTTRPPKLNEEEAKKIVEGTDMPVCYGESLEDTVNRAIPYYKEEIAPKIKSGEKILIAAHGNSLRALMKHIFNISDDEILKLEIPTGTPVICQLDEDLNGIEYNFLTE